MNEQNKLTEPQLKEINMRNPPKFEEYIDYFGYEFNPEVVSILLGRSKGQEMFGRLFMTPRVVTAFIRMLDLIKAQMLEAGIDLDIDFPPVGIEKVEIKPKK